MFKIFRMGMTFLSFSVFTPTAIAQDLSDSRFSLVGSISQKIGGKSVGVALLKDSKTKRTIPVEIGKVFKIGDLIFHVVSVVEGGAVISDGKKLHNIGKSSATASYDAAPRVRPAAQTTPAKFRLTNKPQNTFKKARLLNRAQKSNNPISLKAQKAKTKEIQRMFEEETAAAKEPEDEHQDQPTSEEEKDDTVEGFHDDDSEYNETPTVDSTGVGDSSNQ